MNDHSCKQVLTYAYSWSDGMVKHLTCPNQLYNNDLDHVYVVSHDNHYRTPYVLLTVGCYVLVVLLMIEVAAVAQVTVVDNYLCLEALKR